MGGSLPENDDSEYRQRLKEEWVDYDNLKSQGLTFDLAQVAYWDECHIKQVAGTCVDETLVFSRNEDGLYNDDGEIDEEGNQKVSDFHKHHFDIITLTLSLCHYHVSTNPLLNYYHSINQSPHRGGNQKSIQRHKI